MKLLSLVTLTALLSISSCSHFCKKKQSCCAKKEAQSCEKKQSCDKDKKCADGSCKDEKKPCTGDDCKKK